MRESLTQLTKGTQSCALTEKQEAVWLKQTGAATAAMIVLDR